MIVRLSAYETTSCSYINSAGEGTTISSFGFDIYLPKLGLPIAVPSSLEYARYQAKSVNSWIRDVPATTDSLAVHTSTFLGDWLQIKGVGALHLQRKGSSVMRLKCRYNDRIVSDFEAIS